MKITRHFTEAGKDVFESLEWMRRSSRITNLDGSVVFEMDDVEVPASWSQLATDITVSKYFRKAGVPQRDPDDPDKVLTDKEGSPQTGPERSVRQVVHRMVGCWRHFGQQHGYFDSEDDAQAFYDDLSHMMLHQMGVPNSPQWFNTGLNWAYGINGPAQGHYYVDPESGQTKPSEDAYTHPQPHACFIQSIEDELVNPGGIMDLWVREARLFKYGSGTGTNFSQIRGEDEPLSGGGKSSGLMSFLKIGDRAAGAIKSGGTTRRAAKMVCLDLDHPDVEAFINWKVREELKVAAMVEGLKHLGPDQRQTADRLGLDLDYDFNGEAYQTVSGQNANNSVRIPNEFFERLDEDGDWSLTRRTDGKVAKILRARDLWDQIGYAAWRSADPGVQFHTTVNQWHTCPDSGQIRASNPCSEYLFLDNTACNLASLNLLKFFDPLSRQFDVEALEHAIHLWTIVLEISVLMAQYPSKEIARLSHEYRTLGLGFANLGAMLLQAGIPYDSERARAISGALTAILTGRSYATSAEMAKNVGPFPGYFKNRDHMLRVIRNHRRAAYGVGRDQEEAGRHPLGAYEGLEISPVPIDAEAIDGDGEQFGTLSNGDQILLRAHRCWDEALKLGERHGYRNAQTTVIAPTGTIGLLMDCDTTGVEPDFALVKFKKLAGGGYFKIVNQSLRPALVTLGYSEDQVRAILTYVMGTLSLEVPMPLPDGSINPNEQTTLAQWLSKKGFRDQDLKQVTESLPAVFELPFAFCPWVLGDQTIERLGFADQISDRRFRLLGALGLTAEQVAALNEKICGTQTVEGAPGLLDEHLKVFDCANTCGSTGVRFIAAEGHIRMVAATQSFITGGISKTINLPGSASVEDMKACYRLSWELGLKANALYRDGCKLSQVLSNKVDLSDEVEDQEAVEAGKEEVAAEVAEVADRAATVVTEASEGIGNFEEAARPVEKIVERIVHRPMRRRLPDTRQSVTHKFNVAAHEGYLTVGLYEDGSPGELFITMAKEGSTIGGLMDSLGTAISVALQYGVPVESLVNKFTHQRFEPAGMTHNLDIPFAKSLVDYIFRWLGMEFIPGYRAVNAPQRQMRPAAMDEEAEPTPSQGLAREPKPSVAGGSNGAGHDRGNGHEKTTDRSEDALSRDGAPNRNGGAVDERIRGEEAPHWAPVLETGVEQSSAETAALDTAMKEIQADAPACDVCGTITVRNGTCYKCMNCGNAMGCG